MKTFGQILNDYERNIIHRQNYARKMAKLERKAFKFHSDAAHGWLAVKKDDVNLLGIADKISRYSYMTDNTVYLEEDRDMGLFIEAFKDKFGVEPRIKELDPKDRSHVRSMDSYLEFS